MKAGSLINHLAVHSKNEEKLPEIGTGVTFYSWSDRSAGTVTEVVDEAKMIIGIKHDKATRTDSNGMSDCQSYSYSCDHSFPSVFYRFNKKKAKWESVEKNDNGRWVLAGGRDIKIGHRDAYHDYSF